MSIASSKGTSDDKEADKQRRELLLKAYGSALDEYRFNVNLGWDQTKFYVTTSSAALAAGIGLLRLAIDSMLLTTFMILFFALPGYIAFLGIATADVRKKYVREANLKKALVELELGLAADVFPDIPGTGLGIAVTPGQRDALTAIAKRKDRRDSPIRKGSIVYYTKLLFIGLIIISGSGSMISFFNLCYMVDYPAPSSKK